LSEPGPANQIAESPDPGDGPRSLRVGKLTLATAASSTTPSPTAKPRSTFQPLVGCRSEAGSGAGFRRVRRAATMSDVAFETLACPDRTGRRCSRRIAFRCSRCSRSQRCLSSGFLYGINHYSFLPVNSTPRRCHSFNSRLAVNTLTFEALANSSFVTSSSIPRLVLWPMVLASVIRVSASFCRALWHVRATCDATWRAKYSEPLQARAALSRRTSHSRNLTRFIGSIFSPFRGALFLIAP